MGSFTDDEKNLLQKELKFLSEKGYQLIRDKNSMDYEKNGILISIFNQHHFEAANVSIRYKAYNEIFRVDVFLYYFNNFESFHLCGMTKILASINLLKAHYDEFMDIQWCRTISKIVDGKLGEIFPDVVEPEDFFKIF